MVKRCVMLLAALAAPCGAAPLKPDEVLVVANANSAESVGLAAFYAGARGIPKANIVNIRTVTTYEVSRADYDAQIARPLARVLAARRSGGRIRAAALMWGVPVRVAGPIGAPDSLQGVYRRSAEMARQRLAVDYKLLGTVARKFPVPRTDGLTPLGKLFGATAPTPAKLPNAASLRADLLWLLVSKQMAVREIRETDRKRIAERQLMALYLDLTGLRGLVRFVNENAPASAPDLKDLKKQLAQAVHELGQLRRADTTAENLGKKLDMIEATDGLLGLEAYASRHIRKPPSPKTTAVASVDSELALLGWQLTKLGGPTANPMHWRVRRFALATGRKIPPVLMTARIDGPTAADALRIVKDSLATEKTGLKGTFYIDAGAPARLKTGGEKYDALLTGLAAMAREHAKIKVVLDRKGALFARGACPDAALYVGWYSLGRYVPAFTWQRGAVGWHVASHEAVHLRDPKTTEWCAKMIQNGVAATIGAVREPFLTAFPAPTEFFALLLTGKWTLAECYWRTCPSASWQMTLIGDPLYRPFAANPQLAVDALPPGLAP